MADESKTAGQVAYETYRSCYNANQWPWSDLPAENKERWEAVGKAVIDWDIEQIHPRPKEMRQVPSVGRLVHYVAFGTPGGEYPAGVKRAAIITVVDDPGNPDSDVGLCVLNPTGMFFNTDCPYGRKAGSWHWPDYVAPVPAEG